MNVRTVYSLVFLIVANFAHAANFEFPQSFIQAYDFNGRFNHEYHPALLKKTCQSFVELERAIAQSGFTICHRIGVMGYQEDAIPSYYTDCSKKYINDEAIIKISQGLTSPDRNVFGFITGFLLKDVQWLQERFHIEPRITHIQQEGIDLFSDTALVLQKHAFGDMHENIFRLRDNLEADIASGDMRSILQSLHDFWQYLYETSLNNKFYNTIATQDILFSIEYAQALLDGSTEFKKLFVGPDITYPIEVSDAQKKEVTHHAQEFVCEFMKEVTPLDNKKTAYVFCSFVDGVGKSTLLNNIRNYFLHGNNYDLYQRCDNSSSQEATLYDVDENIVIVDLPGQISHFTTKPQGFVYADINTVQIKKLELIKIMQHIKKNKQQIIADFENGQEISSDDPRVLFKKNCELLRVTDCAWIPFIFNDKHYLFKKKNPHEIRILVPLDEAHSTGLKTIEPELMLFTKGLSLPMALSNFYENLCAQMKEKNIENVVFVDFMSMYPRTSRETVRLNFVLQQLNTIFGERYPTKNLYTPFVHQEQEIYDLLQNASEAVQESLVLEAVMRWAIHDLLVNEQSSLCYYDQDQTLACLRQKCEQLLEQNYQALLDMVQKKVRSELVFRHDKYATDQIYHTVIRHSFENVVKFSDKMVQLFNQGIIHDYFQSLWHGLNTPLSASRLQAVENGVVNFGEAQARIVQNLDAGCKNTIYLEPSLNLLRAQWYATLENLLSCEQCPDGSYRPKKITTLVPPLVVKKVKNQMYLLQKELAPLPSEVKKPVPTLKYHLLDTNGMRKWGMFADKPHCMDWNNPGTFFGLFAYGYNPMEKIKSSITLVSEQIAEEFKTKGLSNFIIPTSEIVNKINEHKLWWLIDKEVELMFQGAMTHIKLNDPRIPMIRLWVKMIATLEMIISDPQAIICVRKGSKSDFASCLKLLERVTLPVYYGIKVDGPLFNDYKTVTPVIGWDAF